jgi:hypothetical protein
MFSAPPLRGGAVLGGGFAAGGASGAASLTIHYKLVILRWSRALVPLRLSVCTSEPSRLLMRAAI